MISAVKATDIGIAAIGACAPPWVLQNDWFQETLARKFVQHTGIHSRHISLEDEVTMAVRAVEDLRSGSKLDLADCAGVVFVSPSMVPLAVAKECPNDECLRQERAGQAAKEFVRKLNIPSCYSVGINWGCSGFSKALSIVHRDILPSLRLRQDEFLLVATASRISRITDFGCKQTAPLFGDYATVTLLARSDSTKYPVHFDLLFAGATMQPADAVFFNYHLRENVMVPTPDGGRRIVARRLVFSLDGLGIGDAAPRAMASATAHALRAAKLKPENVRYVVPHQAGSGIVRFAAMKLEQIGIQAEVINGLTSDVGNVSSCSVPYALKKTWQQLDGTIACPTAGVGRPGNAEVSQGCVLLRATDAHRQ
jgi:3-oxoacyl-[acyl-carrier-protein] synthase III